jgi:hypothetical protein
MHVKSDHREERLLEEAIDDEYVITIVAEGQPSPNVASADQQGRGPRTSATSRDQA